MTPSDLLAPRRIACRVLHEILARRRTFDEVFPTAPGLDALDPRDRAFARLLIAVVLKRLGEIDAVLETLADQPLDRMDPPKLATVLRLGAAQLVFLGTPAHAAVDTSVELAVAEGAGRAKGLVNAVLRRLAREGAPQREAAEIAKLNTPAWLWDAWTQDHGADRAARMALAGLDDPPLDLTVKADPESWAARLGARVLPTGSLRLDTGGAVTALPGFDEGAWWVQNAAAAMPARLLGPVAGKTVVDLCAAPGGKTAQLAAQGARVTAVDRSSTRLSRLKENMARLKFDVEVVAADGAEWRPPAPVDAVLLDAPCTATGTLRHQPDVLRLKTPDDLGRMVETQRRLLRNAAAMLKLGGVLVYCTCSVQKAEGEDQADWLLGQGLGLRLEPARLPGAEDFVTPKGEIRTLPGDWADLGGIDGFYAARFKI